MSSSAIVRSLWWISTPLTRATTGSVACANVATAEAATIAAAAAAVSAMRPGTRKAETDNMVMGISLGGRSVRRFRLLRRTVAQSSANRNRGSALNLNEGVIAARLLRRQGRDWRPIDKGSTPSYLSVNSPVSVGPCASLQHVLNRTCCSSIEWRMLFGQPFRRKHALPEKHPTLVR